MNSISNKYLAMQILCSNIDFIELSNDQIIHVLSIYYHSLQQINSLEMYGINKERLICDLCNLENHENSEIKNKAQLLIKEVEELNGKNEDSIINYENTE